MKNIVSRRTSETAILKACKRHAKRLVSLRVPLPMWVSCTLFRGRQVFDSALMYARSKILYENLLRYRCKAVGKNFMLFGELPLIDGTGDLVLGDNVVMYDKASFFTGGHVFDDSEISIGDGTSIGYETLFRCAKRITVGKNCMIGSWVTVSDNDGHPASIEGRRQHKRVPAKSVKPVVIEDDVWIGEKSVILKGVTIGAGAIVSSGSVVTRSIPPNRVVMGNPARPVMWVQELEEGSESNSEDVAGHAAAADG